ncbi:MAG TPA: T9SS type A sorting domain-containing protein, partial [Ignavibacteriaceae bacterium]
NPFNPSTKISWYSPIGSWQTLKIFDALGREIETLVNEYKDAGVHSTFFNVSSTLPSGIYFYQLKTENYIETKKMILLK